MYFEVALAQNGVLYAVNAQTGTVAVFYCFGFVQPTLLFTFDQSEAQIAQHGRAVKAKFGNVACFEPECLVVTVKSSIEFTRRIGTEYKIGALG